MGCTPYQCPKCNEWLVTGVWRDKSFLDGIIPGNSDSLTRAIVAFTTITDGKRWPHDSTTTHHDEQTILDWILRSMRYHLHVCVVHIIQVRSYFPTFCYFMLFLVHAWSDELNSAPGISIPQAWWHWHFRNHTYAQVQMYSRHVWLWLNTIRTQEDRRYFSI